MEPDSRDASRVALQTVLAGIATNVLGALNECQLLRYPVGADVGFAPLIGVGWLIILFAALFIVVPLGVRLVATKGSRLAGIVAICLGLSTFFVSNAVGRYIFATRQLTMRL